MSKKFHIGELAKRTGYGIHAIRWYESKGLIPGVKRDNGGRRLYSENHVGWLLFIHRLRHTGMTIAEMCEYVTLVKRGSSTLRERQELLSSHKARIMDAITELEQTAEFIDRKIDFYDEWLTTGQEPEMPFLE